MENKEKKEEKRTKEENQESLKSKISNPYESSIRKGLQQKTLKDNIFFYAIITIILVIFLIVFIPKLIPNSQPTLEELHKKNLEDKLSPDKGYVYKGLYSFVSYDGLWYTQLRTHSGQKLFNIPFHYSPRDVEHIEPVGQLNYSNLDRYKNFFMTFDPEDENLNYIAASTSETDMILIQVFGKGIIAACTRNETAACQGRPIVQCNSTDAPVFYFASEEETTLLYLNNCIVISGKNEELFKATDRMLFDLLDIMK